MSNEELKAEVQGGIARRLRVDPSIVVVTVVTALEIETGLVGIDVKIGGTDGTPEQKALIMKYLRETVDPRAFEAPSC